MLFILEDADARIERFRKVLGEIPHHIERAVPEAKLWLEEHGDKVALYSLDNDLYLPAYQGDPGEGWQLCEWLLARGVEATIITHTSNGSAATMMRMACEREEHPFFRVVPIGGWVEGLWIERVETELIAADALDPWKD